MFLSDYRANRIFDNFVASDGRSGKLKKFIENRKARRLATQESLALYEDAKEDGFEGSFLDFLIENREEIFKLIMKLISLFGL